MDEIEKLYDKVEQSNQRQKENSNSYLFIKKEVGEMRELTEYELTLQTEWLKANEPKVFKSDFNCRW